SETSLHRTLSDLTPILDQNRRRRNSIVFAGDLNASSQFPEPYRKAYQLVHQRIEALGLATSRAPAMATGSRIAPVTTCRVVTCALLKALCRTRTTTSTYLGTSSTRPAL